MAMSSSEDKEDERGSAVTDSEIAGHAVEGRNVRYGGGKKEEKGRKNWLNRDQVAVVVAAAFVVIGIGV